MKHRLNINFVAHVGQRQSFASYLNSYEQAVKRLFDDIVSGKESVDLIAPPLLFLMRHSLELGYKFTLWELHQINEDAYNLKAYGNHKLPDLHAALRVQHAKAIAKYDLPDSHIENFNDYCMKTEAAMKIFDQLDFDSFSFRYPLDKKGSPNLPH